nr:MULTISPECIES: hypothetical protein [Porphyromonas]
MFTSHAKTKNFPRHVFWRGKRENSRA